MDPFPKVGLYEILQLLVLEVRPGNLLTWQGNSKEEQLKHECQDGLGAGARARARPRSIEPGINPFNP